MLVLEYGESDFEIEAIDLFCGAGGLTYGLFRAGVNVKLGVDIDPACRYPYTANNNARFLLASVKDLDGKMLSSFFESEDSVKLLAGCAPCQTFSTYNRKANSTDERWWLLLEFSRLVEEVGPDLVTMENVPGLQKESVFVRFVDTLARLGYATHWEIVDCSLYGLPQKRRRLVMLASRLGDISLLTPETFGAKRRNVRDAIAELSPLEHGGQDPNDPLHKCSSLSPLNLERIRASKPGGTWRDWISAGKGYLVAECHRRDSGRTYPGVYARMKWEEPSPTITTQFYGFGNGRFGHPEQDRALSLREGAILQGFPIDYEFVPPGEKIETKTIGRLIGNAVPVPIGEAIGRSFVHHVSTELMKGRHVV